MKSHILIINSFLYLYPIIALANDFQQGLLAYQKDDFLEASRVFKKFAATGNVVAQRYLGEMYDKGRGVPQDYQKALHWYLKAAAQNDAQSQYRLGLKYANGHGVPADNKLAYAWFAMAFNNGFVLAAEPLKVLNKTMNTEERQIALRLAVKQIENLKK